MAHVLTILLIACTSASISIVASDDDAPVTRPNANAPAHVEAQPPDEAQAGPGQDPKVNELLTRLEAAAADLEDFQAKLRYDKWDPVTNRWEIRAGALLYEVKPDDTKRFAMLFDTHIVGTTRRDRLRHYIYDNGWLAEIDHEHKQFIKRQIVPPGEAFDPFKLGEGPFPLPVGQAREVVLARFDVSPLHEPEDERLAGLENVEGLRLIPRPGTREAEHFERVDVFYDTETLLPVGIALVETNETPSLREKKVVRLRDVKRNEGIDPEKLSVEEPDPSEWAISVEPWRGDE